MMAHLTRSERMLLGFTLLYLVVFGVHYLRALNYEFLAYYGVLIGIGLIVYRTLNSTRFPLYVLWGLSVWGLLHMAGGSVQVGDGVLYAYRIFPFFVGEGDFYILKMDQVIHAFGFGVVALASHHLISLHLAKPYSSRAWIGFVAVFVAMGFGAVNEIIEFLAFVILPETGVGDLYNTGLDLIFNALGAVIAVPLIPFFESTHKSEHTHVS